MKILVGSEALRKYIDLDRKYKDTDYFANVPVHVMESMEEIETFTHPLLESWFGDQDRVATLNELYTIKISHIFWDLKGSDWNKHCYDIMLMARIRAELDMGLYNVLYKIWEEKHGKKKANLNALPEDFFNKSVKRVYEHDSIHDSVAYGEKPMYLSILREGHQVAVDMAKWEALSLEDKFKTVREEVYATALERQLIPSEYRASPRAAYHWALKKTITSFSKGWFPLFIVTHLEKLWNPDCDYVQRHKDNADKLIKLEEK